ncbi:MAG: YfiR family protein [Piscinibacter sp.]|nr:YfiR family protein [Piscinibacter sp.]
MGAVSRCMSLAALRDVALPWLIALLGLAAAPLRAQAPASEADAKARFAVTLARFVQWPATAAPEAALHLCVLHDSPALTAAFATWQGTAVGGRTLALHDGEAARRTSCDLVFVDSSAPTGAADAWLRPHEHAALTLGAVDGFLSRGGMVELVNVNDALRFDVNLRALREAHLGLSSQALRLARQVRE